MLATTVGRRPVPFSHRDSFMAPSKTETVSGSAGSIAMSAPRLSARCMCVTWDPWPHSGFRSGRSRC